MKVDAYNPKNSPLTAFSVPVYIINQIPVIFYLTICNAKMNLMKLNLFLFLYIHLLYITYYFAYIRSFDNFNEHLIRPPPSPPPAPFERKATMITQ